MLCFLAWNWVIKKLGDVVVTNDWITKLVYFLVIRKIIIEEKYKIVIFSYSIIIRFWEKNVYLQQGNQKYVWT